MSALRYRFLKNLPQGVIFVFFITQTYNPQLNKFYGIKNVLHCLNLKRIYL